jgi:hypothetical protein
MTMALNFIVTGHGNSGHGLRMEKLPSTRAHSISTRS